MSKLTNRGYTVEKISLGSRELFKIKKELTVQPFVSKEFSTNVTSFPVYLENHKKLYLPKYYGLKELGQPDKILINEGNDIELEFLGSMRPLQQEVVDVFMSHCKHEYGGGGVVCLRAGGGKTVVSLKLICELKRKTLVVVNKEFLLNQWMERIKMFIPEAKIGRIQQNIVDIQHKDIVIAMLQSLSLKEYPDDVFKSFGFTIVDECHHISSEVFSRSLPKISTKYTLGLSATPQRKDGLTKVFTWYLGDIIFKNKTNDVKNTVYVKSIFYNWENELYNKEELNYNGKLCMPKMINNICGYMDRTKMCIDILSEVMLEKHRKVLILSDRREHLKIIDIYLEKLDYTKGFYVGGMKQKDLNISETKQIILGTYSMSSEALDIPELNTLLLMSPKSDVEQTIGRILRKQHIINPFIIDIVDTFGPFKRQYLKREKFYKQCKYQILKTEMNHTDNIKEKMKQLEPMEGLFDIYVTEKASKSKKSSKTDKNKKTDKTKAKKCEIVNSDED